VCACVLAFVEALEPRQDRVLALEYLAVVGDEDGISFVPVACTIAARSSGSAGTWRAVKSRPSSVRR
jgi:hypothetical protein